jgi:hypothetical protein
VSIVLSYDRGHGTLGPLVRAVDAADAADAAIERLHIEDDGPCRRVVLTVRSRHAARLNGRLDPIAALPEVQTLTVERGSSRHG